MAGSYRYAAHPTMYRGVRFRSRLEARWACFFDLVGWHWEYEPFDLAGWTPDFLVRWPCGHSECNGSHSLLVEVKPYLDIDSFKGHRCMDFPYGWNDVESIPADASAAFGNNPHVTYWEMCHGAGGGQDSVECWIVDVDDLWNTAGNIVRYCPRID